MNIYETLILSVPEITDDESNKLETQFSKVVSKAKGETVSFEKWGKYKLAYPVKQNEYGVYFLTRYKLPEESVQSVVNELRSFFSIKFNEIVMREITCVLDNGSLEYSKPKALEDLPDDAVDSFLRENKMEGLLNKNKKLETKSNDASRQDDSKEKVSEKAIAKEASEENIEKSKEKLIEEKKEEVVAEIKEKNG